jgi:tetratricopeptide (TPR) repeat protein
MKRCFSAIAAIVLSASASCQRAPDWSVRDTDRTPAVKPSKVELDEMRKESETPVDYAPPKWAAVYSEGVQLLSQGNYRVAIQKLTESIELAPKFGLAYINRGVAFRDLGDYKKALSDLRKGADLDRIAAGYMPMAYEAEILACTSPSHDGNAAQTIELAKSACEQAHGNSFFAIAVLAAAYANAGDFESALHWQHEATRVLAEDRTSLGAPRQRLTEELATRTSLYTAHKPCRTLFPDPFVVNRQSPDRDP